MRAPAELEDSYPNPLPDLFYGQELIVFGRYRGRGSGELVLEGSRGGEPERFRYRVEFPERESGNEFIPKLWASRKVGALTAHIRLNGPNPEVVDEIRELGLRYGIITEYTSYLVEEPELALTRDAAELTHLRVQAFQAPAAEQFGAAAVRRADASSRLREAAKVADLAAAMPASNRAGAARHAGDRFFVPKDGTWTDVGFDRSLKIVKVEPFSPAYFELAHRLPAFRAYFALGERVLVAGDGLAVEVVPGGLTSWEPTELRAVLRAFRAVASR